MQPNRLAAIAIADSRTIRGYVARRHTLVRTMDSLMLANTSTVLVRRGHGGGALDRAAQERFDSEVSLNTFVGRRGDPTANGGHDSRCDAEAALDIVVVPEHANISI